MNQSIQRAAILMVGAVVLFSVGCRKQTTREETSEGQAKTKLAAINRFADAVAQDPNGGDAFEALELFRNTQYDPTEQKDIGEQILEVYRTRIAGKYKGDLMTQMASAVKSFENDLKK